MRRFWKVYISLAPVVIILLIIGIIVKMNVDSEIARTPETTTHTVVGTPLNDDTLIILFTHAGDDAEGNRIDQEVIIQNEIKDSDIPYFDDHDQLVTITCKNPTRLRDAENALRAHGYNNIMIF